MPAGKRIGVLIPIRRGRIDGLVNAAGIFQTASLLDITPEDFDRMFAINVRALFFLQQSVARRMAAGGGGSIVNFSSTAAQIPRPLSSHYAASKAAVISFTRSAAAALGPSRIRVNAICPGIIQTPMIDALLRSRSKVLGTTPDDLRATWTDAHPLGRLGLPSEVAGVVVFLLSDASSCVSGESIGIHGGPWTSARPTGSGIIRTQTGPRQISPPSDRIPHHGGKNCGLKHLNSRTGDHDSEVTNGCPGEFEIAARVRRLCVSPSHA